MPRSKEIFPLTSAYLEDLHDYGIAITWPGVEPVARHDCIDLNLLESAVKQPFQAVFGEDCYPTIFDKAACLFFSIIANHLFNNGNKRTAVLAVDQFLHANYFYLTLENKDMRKLAEATASYRTRGENHKDVIARISSVLRTKSIPISATRKDPKIYRNLLRTKNMIREFPSNAPGTPPEQALLAGRRVTRS